MTKHFGNFLFFSNLFFSILSSPVIYERKDSNVLNIRPISETFENENNQSSLITINVSGNRFQTYISTLEYYPETLLGDETKRKHYWRAENKEYFFNRHRACFESILYYYQSQGRLRRPESVPIDTFLEAITFFQLGAEAIAQVHQIENIKIVKQTPMPRILWRRYIWYYLEFPQHSLPARLINIFSLLFTIVSCISLAIESLPKYNQYYENICRERAHIPTNSTLVPRCSALFSSPFFIIQTICVAYFLIEFLLRLISTPSYIRFVFSFFNWIDVTSIVPFFIFLGIQLSNEQIDVHANAYISIKLLRVLRFVRIFKIYLVINRLKALRVLSATVKESFADFTVMVVILTLISFLFGAIAYFAEQGTNGAVFDSIPKATYWGIITVTGVGYGDMYPVSTIGRIMTCLGAFVGAGMMAMLVSVLVGRYQRVYNRKMFVPDIRNSSLNLNEIRENPSVEKLSRREQLPSFINRSISTIQKNIRSDQRRSSIQKYKVQFAVTFDTGCIESQQADAIVNTMKEKMSEAALNAGTGVDIKIIEQVNDRLWATNIPGRPSETAPPPPPTTTNRISTINEEYV